MRIDFGRHGAEVVAVDIVYIAIAIIVDTGGTVELGLVYIHVLCEVLVAVVHTTVDNGHNHLGISGGHLPCLGKVDVGAGHSAGYGAIVVVVPLCRKLRVVEHVVGRSSLHRWTGGGNEIAVAFHERHRHNGLRFLNAGYGFENLASLLRFYRFIEFYHIPAVEAILGSLGGKFFGIREHRSYAHGFNLLGCTRQWCRADIKLALGFHARRRADKPGCFGLEFHTDHTRTRLLRLLLYASLTRVQASRPAHNSGEGQKPDKNFVHD